MLFTNYALLNVDITIRYLNFFLDFALRCLTEARENGKESENRFLYVFIPYIDIITPLE